jgi:septum formation protein
MIPGFPEGVKIILASRSPRRQQLLRDAGLDFEVAVYDYDETFKPGLTGPEIAEALSLRKAMSFEGKLIAGQSVLITADTVVWHKGEVLDKPQNFDEAFITLKKLSGHTHSVITGVTLRTGKHTHTFSETTYVTFEPLTDKEISYYIAHCAPYDKAGAYGIQEWIGLTAISRIEGSYFNVMGLPVHTVIKELREFLNTKY